ncbi:type VII secretion system-associated protein [Streptomyces sp. NPDC055078]
MPKPKDPTEDPNSKTGRISLDKAGLEAFLTDRVEAFQTELTNIMKDDAKFGVSMDTLTPKGAVSGKDFDSYGTQKPLALGKMLDSSHLAGLGADLNAAVARTAKDLTEIQQDQNRLFRDLEENLRTSIRTLFKAQTGNLMNIDGQDFLDSLEDLGSGLSGSQKSGTGGGGA